MLKVELIWIAVTSHTNESSNNDNDDNDNDDNDKSRATILLVNTFREKKTKCGF